MSLRHDTSWGVSRGVSLAITVFLTISIAACGGDTSGDDRDRPSFAAGTTMEKLSRAGKLIVGTKFDQPYFGLKGLDGKPAGFDIEIAEIIADELGIPANKITYREAQSSVRESVIEQGTVDIVVATYTINDKRKERVDFAGPYYVAGQQIMVRSDDASIAGPDAFRDGTKKVCSVTGSTPAANIKNYLKDEGTQLVLFGDYQKCADALKEKIVDAVTTDNVILAGFVSKSDGKFKRVGTKFTEEPYGVGLAKGDVAFRAFINDVLESIAKDGRYERAWKDTIGKVDPTIPTPPPVNRY